MFIKKKTFYLVFFCFFYGCKASKNTFYSYTINSFTIDSVKTLFSTSRFISYDNYLFEFKMRTNYFDEYYVESNKKNHKVFYDTIGVYLLSLNNKLYSEFDTFSIKNKIVKTGKVTDKETGLKFTSDTVNSNKQFKNSIGFAIPQKITINNIECYYSRVNSNNDTIDMKILLVKKDNFNSFYKVSGFRFTYPKFCVIGSNFNSIKNKQGFSEEIEGLKYLTEKEKDICENLIKKSKTIIIDTIKGITKNDLLPFP